MEAFQPEEESLIGQHLTSSKIVCPAAVINRSVVKRNCDKMLRAVDALGLSWRPHIKTHKVDDFRFQEHLLWISFGQVKLGSAKRLAQTAEVTRLQVGTDAKRPVRLVVSTVKEAEHLVPFVKDIIHREGRTVDVLYGVPPSSTCFARLLRVAKACGKGFTLGFLLDHPAQLANFSLPEHSDADTDIVRFWMKVDTGYHRAGNLPTSQQFRDVFCALTDAEDELSRRWGQPKVLLHGFYSHMGNSYGSSSPDDALTFLAQEIERGVEAIEEAVKLRPSFERRRFTLSVGATPTVASTQNLVLGKEQQSKAGVKVSKLIVETRQKHELEVHAGVYPFLDLQQLATHARPVGGNHQNAAISEKDIGICIIAEVISVYGKREAADSSGRPEALIGAGCLALGREPCKSYAGWGVLAPSPWESDHEGSGTKLQSDHEAIPAEEAAAAAAGGKAPAAAGKERKEEKERGEFYDEHSKTGWIVNRISQDHGILSWEGAQQKLRPLQVGSKIMVWPNHACIAAAGYDRLLVVDEAVNGGCEVVDVWQRCRGW